MNAFTTVFDQVSEYQTILRAVTKTRLPMGVTGLSSVHKAHVIASLCQKTQKAAWVLVPDEAQGNRLVSDLTGFSCRALLYPARDFTFRPEELQSHEYEQKRLQVLTAVLRGECDVVVLSAEAAAQLTLPPEILQKHSFTLQVGQDYALDGVLQKLAFAGYARADQVEGPGQFALRGGVLDIFSPGDALPARLEFWGDTVDSLSRFQPDTQRRTDALTQLVVVPATEVLVPDSAALADTLSALASSLRGKYAAKARELLCKDADLLRAGVRVNALDRYLPLVYPRPAMVWDYMPDALLFVSESFAVREAFQSNETLFLEMVKGYLEEGILCKGLDPYQLRWAQVALQYAQAGAIYLDNLPRGSFDTPVKELVTVSAQQLTAWNGSLSVLLGDIGSTAKRQDHCCVVLAGTAKAARSLCDDLEMEGLRSLYLPQLPAAFPRGTVCVMQGGLSSGFAYPQAKFLLYAYSTRQAAAKKKKGAKGFRAKDMFHSLDELHKGDYVVHKAHGIGRFEGIVNLEAGGTRKDYIKIQYDKSDVLYVPVTQLDQVSKYIGPQHEDKPLKLNKLGGKEWKKTQSRVRGAVKEMAKELIALYAKRMQLKGHAFSQDIDMQNDFERRFAFEETSDQLRCIDEVKKDMEAPHPMDRLLCGDVGFGKTEVALRAAFKCIADGRQCAILVPTTILALQHYQTVNQRFEGFPIETGMLSRFCSKQEMQATIQGLRRGSVDLVVGTHRLISKDIKFWDLGLIVVDEEQRFGVAQKERLKEMFPTVDVLTLSATPIPRTLNMAMSGIRDMSVLEEAPQDRSPVQTFVLEHNWHIIGQAIRAELRRGGQVYYLHNRVESIQKTAAKLKETVPEARIGIGHGQMGEDALSDVWRTLLEGEIDILVCTTIIEAGVDVPNVNTLIIEDADRMGLSQLHQIRGRVGRSTRRANAYLTFRRGKQLTEIATNRLGAIREFTEFGSGFKIAMRDLELRGAGNILGSQQHGHMEAVGYEMYLQLLEQAVQEEKGEVPQPKKQECSIDLQLDAYIPEDYISSVPQRLAMYRRIADIQEKPDAEDVLDELIDRFGEPPESVQGLVTVALLRGSAIRHNIREVTQQGDRLILQITQLDMDAIASLAKFMPGRITVSAAGKPHIAVRLRKGQKQLEALTEVLARMDAAQKKTPQDTKSKV